VWGKNRILTKGNRNYHTSPIRFFADESRVERKGETSNWGQSSLKRQNMCKTLGKNVIRPVPRKKKIFERPEDNLQKDTINRALLDKARTLHQVGGAVSGSGGEANNTNGLLGGKKRPTI